MVAKEGKSPYFRKIQVGEILQFGRIYNWHSTWTYRPLEKENFPSGKPILFFLGPTVRFLVCVCVCVCIKFI